MIDEHWFDILNKRMGGSTPRRGILSAVATLSILQRLGTLDAEGKGGGKGGKQKGGDKGEKGGGKKGNGKKKSPKPDKGGICGRTWPGKDQKDDRDHCRRIFAECPPDGDHEFCIVDDYPGHEGDLVADCCEDGEICCGQKCCYPGSMCCDGSCIHLSSSDALCCDGKYTLPSADRENCGGCGIKCGPNEFCSSGGCVCENGSSTTCDHSCPDGMTKCGDECVDTLNDPKHCGGCFLAYPNINKCCNGNPCTYVNGVCCGGTCYPEYWPSCE